MPPGSETPFSRAPGPNFFRIQYLLLSPRVGEKGGEDWLSAGKLFGVLERTKGRKESGGGGWE